MEEEGREGEREGGKEGGKEAYRIWPCPSLSVVMVTMSSSVMELLA